MVAQWTEMMGLLTLILTLVRSSVSPIVRYSDAFKCNLTGDDGYVTHLADNDDSPQIVISHALV